MFSQLHTLPVLCTLYMLAVDLDSPSSGIPEPVLGFLLEGSAEHRQKSDIRTQQAERTD